MTRGEKILVVWLLCMGFILGYGVCLGIHRHQAGQDFQRGREWSEKYPFQAQMDRMVRNNPTGVYSCIAIGDHCITEPKFEGYPHHEPIPKTLAPEPSYSADGGNPK